MSYCYEFAAPNGVFGVRSAVDIAQPLQLFAGLWPWRTVAGLATVDVEISRVAAGGLRVHMPAHEGAMRQIGTEIDSASGALDMLTRLTMEQLGPYAMLHAGSALIDG